MHYYIYCTQVCYYLNIDHRIFFCLHVPVSLKGVDLSSSKRVISTLDSGMTSQKSTSFYESSSVPKSSATKNSSELMSTIYPTFLSSPDTSTRFADNGTLTTTAIHSTNTEEPGPPSEGTVQESKSSIVSPKTLGGPVNRKTRTSSSVVTTSLLLKKSPNLQKLSTSEINSTFRQSISTIVQATHSDVTETHQTEDPVSTSKNIFSHTNSARLESGTPSLPTSVDWISVINQTRVTTVGLLVNMSTSPTVRTPKTSHLTPVHTPIKPSSSVASVIPASSKEVPSAVSPTKDIVSNWAARPHFINREF